MESGGFEDEVPSNLLGVQEYEWEKKHAQCTRQQNQLSLLLQKENNLPNHLESIRAQESMNHSNIYTYWSRINYI